MSSIPHPEEAPGISEAVIRQYQFPDKALLRREKYRFADHPEGDYWRFFVDHLPLRGDETVLDGGCGVAEMLGDIKDRGHTGPLIGVDINSDIFEVPKKVDAQKGKRLIDFRVGSVTNLPAADGEANVIIESRVLYHEPEVNRAIRECIRVNPEGLNVFSTRGPEHLKEQHALQARVARNLGVRPPTKFDSFDYGFASRTLRQFFRVVEHLPYRAHIDIPEAEHPAFVAAIDSLMSYNEEYTTHDGKRIRMASQIWKEIFEATLTDELAQQSRRFGRFQLTVDIPIFFCSQPRPDKPFRAAVQNLLSRG